MPRIKEISSIAWWVGPLPSDKNPGIKLLSFTGKFGIPASVRTNSNARMVKNDASACTTGMRPRKAKPGCCANHGLFGNTGINKAVA